jgi:hypothetical protein
MLAVTQLARSPRQSLRLIMLLAFATAFAVFTLVFAASQAQRAVDISAYQSGADFSGNIPLSVTPRPLKEETRRYRNIAGVTSATSGYIEVKTMGVPSALFPLGIRPQSGPRRIRLKRSPRSWRSSLSAGARQSVTM